MISRPIKSNQYGIFPLVIESVSLHGVEPFRMASIEGASERERTTLLMEKVVPRCPPLPSPQDGQSLLLMEKVVPRCPPLWSPKESFDGVSCGQESVLAQSSFTPLHSPHLYKSALLSLALHTPTLVV